MAEIKQKLLYGQNSKANAIILIKDQDGTSIMMTTFHMDKSTTVQCEGTFDTAKDIVNTVEWDIPTRVTSNQRIRFQQVSDKCCEEAQGGQQTKKGPFSSNLLLRPRTASIL